MRLETQYQDAPGYLIVRVSGQWTEKSAKEAIEETRSEADRRGFTRVLLDAFGLSAPDREMTRFYTGEHIARTLPPPLRVAAVGKEELINYFAENVAANRGAIFAVFTDEDVARRWLLEGSDRSTA